MRRIGTIGGLAGAGLALTLVAGSAAAAECRTELSAVLEETPDVSQLPQDRAVLARRTLRELATVARQLAADGHELACMATLDALAKTMTEYQIVLIEGEPAGTVRGAEDLAQTDAALDVRDPRLVPLTDERLAFTTDEVAGNAVFSYEGDRVGEFHALVAGPTGYASHAVIGHGGFWDMFDDRAAIPVDLVRWDPERRLFYIPLDEDELDAAPEYDADGRGWDADLNDRYYAGLTD